MYAVNLKIFQYWEQRPEACLCESVASKHRFHCRRSWTRSRKSIKLVIFGDLTTPYIRVDHKYDLFVAVQAPDISLVHIQELERPGSKHLEEGAQTEFWRSKRLVDTKKYSNHYLNQKHNL